MNSARAETNVTMKSGGNATFIVSGALNICGGNLAGTACDASISTPSGAVALGAGAVAAANALLETGALKVNAGGDVLILGGTFTGNASAYAGMTASGPINIDIGGAGGLSITGGSTGPVGSGIFVAPTSPVAITYPGGGALKIINDPLRDGAFIQSLPVLNATLPDQVQLAINTTIDSINKIAELAGNFDPVAKNVLDYDQRARNRSLMCRP